MPDGEDWLYRPVVKGMCLYESYKNGTLDLFDIAEMNDVLDVVDENRQIAHDLARRRNA